MEQDPIYIGELLTYFEIIGAVFAFAFAVWTLSKQASKISAELFRLGESIDRLDHRLEAESSHRSTEIHLMRVEISELEIRIRNLEEGFRTGSMPAIISATERKE